MAAVPGTTTVVPQFEFLFVCFCVFLTRASLCVILCFCVLFSSCLVAQ